MENEEEYYYYLSMMGGGRRVRGARSARSESRRLPSRSQSYLPLIVERQRSDYVA